MVTYLLLIISAIVFAILFVAFIYLSVKIAPSRVEREKIRKFSGPLSSFISALIAMIVVSFLQGQFPSLTWWIIEFGVAYVLESFVADRLALWVYGHILPPEEAQRVNPEDEIIQLYVSRVALKMWHRLVFFVASLGVGFGFLSPVLFFEGKLPLWVTPFIFGPYVTWLAVFFQRHFPALEGQGLSKVYRDLSLHMKCIYVALKPAEAERAEHPWLLPLFYVSLAIPAGCLLVPSTILIS